MRGRNSTWYTQGSTNLSSAGTMEGKEIPTNDSHTVAAHRCMHTCTNRREKNPNPMDSDDDPVPTGRQYKAKTADDVIIEQLLNRETDMPPRYPLSPPVFISERAFNQYLRQPDAEEGPRAVEDKQPNCFGIFTILCSGADKGPDDGFVLENDLTDSLA
eukprot:gb/GECG01000125.1/.p1 GENE.gb/GECG01000125.1/~~gb/GECG01000125.1/.p1  ORF type:complete len:159 (+),score=21.09 gb/GECG01000125.1/:1-477(+)